ncbi:hypothetical protein J4433_00245 [Candidatus Pacearchaeota archaeon]|nr:hypothetical protein [Candidatus Pacearchaeota archaeon]
MRISFFMSGFLVFSFGILLMLPSIVMNASATEIKTTNQALSTITGRVIREVGSINADASTFSKISAWLVIIGLILMAVSLLFKFV